MPTTRKKIIKTVYKDEESEGETGDFSDSGSEAKISEASSSEDDIIHDEDDILLSSGDEFCKAKKGNKKVNKPPIVRRKPKFAKDLVNKINNQVAVEGDDDNDLPASQFSVKDLTETDKLLPSFLNLSESDSSDDESQTKTAKKKPTALLTSIQEHDSDNDDRIEYRDVWSSNFQDNSEDVAKKTFMELEKHKTEIEQTKASIENYVSKNQAAIQNDVSKNSLKEFNVNDLLAQGEEIIEEKIPIKKKVKARKQKNDSESEVEDWEEVNEAKSIPQQGLQLFVELPNAVKKSKKLDVEMMMKRKINRVKKEYQVYMHQVHVLCWLGHGNYVSRVLNDQEVMAAALSMVPKGCYPEERVTTKYVEQITTWYKDKLTLKQDKHEHKFRPKAPPLKNTILNQIKSRVTSAKKYNIFIFVAMLRALGLQCRVMFNFVTVPIRPPSSELCSLSMKSKDDSNKAAPVKSEEKAGQNNAEKKNTKETTKNDKSPKKFGEKSAKENKLKATAKSKAKCPKNITQVDGIDDTFSESDSECDNIMQLDGSDDTGQKTRSTRSTRAKKIETNTEKEGEGVSPPKKAKPNHVQGNIPAKDKSQSNKDKLKTIKDVTENASDVLLPSQVTLNSDEAPEVPKSTLRKRPVRIKGTNTKSETSKAPIAVHKDEEPPNPPPRRTVRNIGNTAKTTTNNTKLKTTKPQKNDIAADIIHENDHKPQDEPTSPFRERSVKGNNNISHNSTTSIEQEVSKSAHINVNTEKDKIDTSLDKPQESPPIKSVKNQDGSEKTEKASIKRATSISLQTKKNALEKNGNKIETNIINGLTNNSASSPKTLSLSLSKNASIATQPQVIENSTNPRKERSKRRNHVKINRTESAPKENTNKNNPTITVTDENLKTVKSQFFSENKEPAKQINISRKRSHTNVVNLPQTSDESNIKSKTRTKSAPGTSLEKSKYFDNREVAPKKLKLDTQHRQTKKEQIKEDKLRVTHRDLRQKAKPKNDVIEDLVDIIKSRIKVEKAESKKGIVIGKVKDESDDDSDFLPVEDPKSHNDSDEDFKPTKISPRPPKINPKPGGSKKLDRRVLSSDDDVAKQSKVDVWCEVFVEELEQWIAVDVIKGMVHCSSDLYTHATHPVCYVVGWDNNNYLKDLTRRYVPHWNTLTRKQRAGPDWWKTALQPWLGPKTARDREEDEYLDRMQLEAPLPKSIAEYKNHPLYALKRHLLKFEALYPPDAATLGFVRGEAVYARECVHTCQSRDKWLKEAKVVRLAEQPYKVVKARPKWDRLSNKCITDKPLEVFGPWQVQDYEPPTAENGIVPRNAYGNVELFKACMLPKKTVHIKLPGLNKVAKKLNIDCAPAMTGFEFNGGFSHPVYDGFVVCEEFEEIVTEAWIEDQEDQERREREKVELRVYGNWKRLVRGLMIRERLKLKYGFEEPSTSQTKPKSKGPRLVVKKK